MFLIYVYCMVCYFTDRTRLPRSVLLQLALLPSSAYLSSHVTYTSVYEDDYSYLRSCWLATLPVQFITSAHSLLWLCCPHPDQDQCNRFTVTYLPRRSAIHTTIIINRLTVQCSNLINLISFYCLFIYLFWLVIILLICACILSLSSS